MPHTTSGCAPRHRQERTVPGASAPRSGHPAGGAPAPAGSPTRRAGRRPCPPCRASHPALGGRACGAGLLGAGPAPTAHPAPSGSPGEPSAGVGPRARFSSSVKACRASGLASARPFALRGGDVDLARADPTDAPPLQPSPPAPAATSRSRWKRAVVTCSPRAAADLGGARAPASCAAAATRVSCVAGPNWLAGVLRAGPGSARRVGEDRTSLADGAWHADPPFR